MYYSESNLENLLGEHAAIRGHLKTLKNIIQEWKMLLTSKTGLTQAQDKLGVLEEKRAGLQQAMGYLADGLKNHHDHEECVMPMLVGDLLMRAIRLEHDEMLKTFKKIDMTLINGDLNDFLKKGQRSIHSIERMCELLDVHSTKEDGILEFLKKLPELKKAPVSNVA